MLIGMVAVSVERLRHDLGALEASADRAGLALACTYSSAAEFEAELIALRRAAGAYGNPHVVQLRLLLVTTAVVAAAMLLVLIT